MNESEDNKPPSISDSEGSCSPIGNNRIGIGDLYWIPIWRGGSLPSMAIYWDTCRNSLYKHSSVDLGLRKDD